MTGRQGLPDAALWDRAPYQRQRHGVTGGLVGVATSARRRSGSLVDMVTSQTEPLMTYYFLGRDFNRGLRGERGCLCQDSVRVIRVIRGFTAADGWASRPYRALDGVIRGFRARLERRKPRPESLRPGNKR